MLVRSWFAVRPPRCPAALTFGSRAAGTSISHAGSNPAGSPPVEPGALKFVTISFQTKRTGKGVIIAGTGRAGGPGSRDPGIEQRAEAKRTVNHEVHTRYIGLGVEIESRILTVRSLCSAVGVR
jgi:hypothetical protein